MAAVLDTARRCRVWSEGCLFLQADRDHSLGKESVLLFVLHVREQVITQVIPRENIFSSSHFEFNYQYLQ